MALPQLRLLAAFGLAAACGVGSAGIWMLVHPQPHAQNQPEHADAAKKDSQPAADGEPSGAALAAQSSHAGTLEEGHATPRDSAGDPVETAPDVAHDLAAENGHPDEGVHHEFQPPAQHVPAPNGPAVALHREQENGHAASRIPTLPPPSPIKRDPLRVQADLIRADDSMRRGDMAKAMRLYGMVIQAKSPSVDPVVYFRWALCSESLGLLDEASQRYQILATQSNSPAWRGFARWGLARVLHRQSRTDLAIRIAAELWLTQDESAPLWRDDLAHWLGHLMYRRAINDRAKDLLDESTLASCELNVSMRLLLALCLRIHADEVGEALPVAATDDEEPQALQISASTRIGDLALSVEQTTVAEAMADIARERHWVLNWSNRSLEVAKSRGCRLQVTADAPTIVDAACETSGLIWSIEGSVLTIADQSESMANEQDNYRLASAARSLAYAIDAMPGNRWTDFSRIGLAQLAAIRGEYAVAQRTLEDLVSAPGRSTVIADAWYDLGKLRARDRRLDEAMTAFQRCADHAEGSQLEPLSNLYLGRLLLEAERTREAILSLRRAAALSGPVERPKAVLTLVAAYLADGRPQSANEVLRAYKADLDVASYRDASAFLSTLSQVRGASDPFRKKYDQKWLMAAISHVKPDDFFSWQVAALIVEAYRDLGLPSEAAQVAQYSVDHMPPCALRQRIRLVLAQDAQDRGDAPGAFALWTEIIKTSEGDVRLQARTSLCAALLANDRLEESKRVSREWLEAADSPEDQSAALRALGRCLEREGDRLNAALCFAGSRPTAPAPSDSQTE